MTHFSGIVEDMIPLPPRGMNVSTCTIGNKVRKQFTYLCEEDENCYAMETSEIEIVSREMVIGKHACPAPLRRSVFPSGKSHIMKMWDTLDAAVDSYVASRPFLDCKTIEETLGFMKGMYEAIACWGFPKYTAEEVRLEAKRRLDMRKHRTPYSPTPGYSWQSPHRMDSESSADAVATSKAKTKTRRSNRGETIKVIEVSAPKPKIFNEDEVLALKAMADSGVLISDLANLYNVSEARIKALLNPEVQYGGIPLPF
jgi:hypothetical protein